MTAYMTTYTDRLREGMPFIDHAGLGAYEVEAYTFLYAVSSNMYSNKVFTGYPRTATPDEFGKVRVDLGLDGYSFSKFIDGVNTFKNSGYNNSGKYDSYKSYFPLSWKPLLKLYNIKSR